MVLNEELKEKFLRMGSELKLGYAEVKKKRRINNS
jgi:hypothetical protein